MKQEGEYKFKSETTIYGDVLSVNGDEVTMLVTTGETITFEVDPVNLELLSGRIGQTVGLKGVASYTFMPVMMVAFEFIEVTPYVGGDILEGFRKLREISSGFWDNLSEEEINEHLKG